VLFGSSGWYSPSIFINLYRLPKCIKHTSDYYTGNENTIMCDLLFVLIVFVRQIAKFMLFY